MKRKHLILAVLAIVLVLCASIGAASAYFTTYADARGGYVIHMKYETVIDEEVKGNIKHVTIYNNATDPDTPDGTYPVFVRARVFAGNDVIATGAGTNWSKSGDIYFYTDVLYTGDHTELLDITVSAAKNSGIRPGDPIDVIVTFESVPAVFFPNGDPDMETSWANDSLIKTIETR